MELLHQWYDEASCAFTYCPVDKQMSAAVMIDTVEWHLKTGQVSPI
jgi:hypothetical protein